MLHFRLFCGALHNFKYWLSFKSSIIGTYESSSSVPAKVMFANSPWIHTFDTLVALGMCFLLWLQCIQLGPICVRITALEVMLLISHLNSIALQLKMLRLRMDQDLQRSFVWLGDNFVPGLLILNPKFFAQSTLRSLFFQWHIYFGARIKQEALHVTV